MAGDVNSHIDGGAVGMDHGQALFAVRRQLVAVLPHIGVEDQDHAGLLGAIEQRLIHHAGVLDAVARIGTRILGLRALDGREHHVDFAVAVGMRGDLEAGVVHRLERLVEIGLRARGRNAEVAGLIGIFLGKPAGAAAQRVAVEDLDGGERAAGRRRSRSSVRRPAALGSWLSEYMKPMRTGLPASRTASYKRNDCGLPPAIPALVMPRSA